MSKEYWKQNLMIMKAVMKNSICQKDWENEIQQRKIKVYNIYKYL